MAKKLYDLAVKTGSYTNRDGDEKGRYENVGAVLQMDDGGKVILLKRTFNPAGVPNPEDRDTVLLSMFEPKERDDQPAPAQKEHAKAKGNGYQKGGSVADMSDDIPF